MEINRSPFRDRSDKAPNFAIRYPKTALMPQLRSQPGEAAFRIASR